MAPATTSGSSSSTKVTADRKPLLEKTETHVSFSESESQHTTAETAKDLEARSASDDDVDDDAYDSDEASDLEENDAIADAGVGGLCAKRMTKRHRWAIVAGGAIVLVGGSWLIYNLCKGSPDKSESHGLAPTKNGEKEVEKTRAEKDDEIRKDDAKLEANDKEEANDYGPNPGAQPEPSAEEPVNPRAREPTCPWTPGADTPGADTPGADTPGAGTPGADTPGAGTPGADTPTQPSVDDIKYWVTPGSVFEAPAFLKWIGNKTSGARARVGEARRKVGAKAQAAVKKVGDKARAMNDGANKLWTKYGGKRLRGAAVGTVAVGAAVKTCYKPVSEWAKSEWAKGQRLAQLQQGEWLADGLYKEMGMLQKAQQEQMQRELELKHITEQSDLGETDQCFRDFEDSLFDQHPQDYAGLAKDALDQARWKSVKAGVAVAAAAETLAQHNKQADALQAADDFIALESTDELVANKEAAEQERAAAAEALEAAEDDFHVVDSLDQVTAQYQDAIRAGKVPGLSEETCPATARAAARLDAVEKAQHRLSAADEAFAAADKALAAAQKRNSKAVEQFQDRKNSKAAALTDEARGAQAAEGWTPLSREQQRRERLDAAERAREAADKAVASKWKDLKYAQKPLNRFISWLMRAPGVSEAESALQKATELQESAVAKEQASSTRLWEAVHEAEADQGPLAALFRRFSRESQEAVPALPKLDGVEGRYPSLREEIEFEVAEPASPVV